MQSCRAFSLLELTVALTIISILSAITFPIYRHLVAENHVTATVNKIITTLNYARLAAINSKQPIKLCKSADSKHCVGNWHDGQIIQDSLGHVLRIFGPLPAGDKLIWNSSAGRDDYIEFTPLGFTNGQQGSFYYCYKGQTFSQVIVINHAGRAYIKPMLSNDYSRYCL